MMFRMTLYQYDIHIIVSHENETFHTTTIIFLHFFQFRGWMCAVSVEIGHCAPCSCDLNEWQVASMHSALVVLLSSAQLYKPRIELKFTLREKGIVQDDPRSERMVQPSFHYTGWPIKSRMAYFQHYRDSITVISVWGNFSWEKLYQDQQFWFSSLSSREHFMRQCRGLKFSLFSLY